MKTILLATAAALITATAASAQTTDGKFNVGAGYTYLDAEGVSFDAVTLRGGYDVTEYFGVEAEALIGVGEDELTIAGVDFETSLNYGLGLYAKGQYPVSEALSVFGRLGYVWAELEGEALGLSFTDEDNGVAYGLGAEYAFNGPNAVRAEYTLYDFGNDSEADGFSVSYVRRF